MSDSVNHPKHYNSHPSGVEAIEILRHMNFNCGNALKYIWRADHKSETPIEDLKKAAWYLQDELKRLGSGHKIPVDVSPELVDAYQNWTQLDSEFQIFVTKMQDIFNKHKTIKRDSWKSMSMEDMLVRIKEELRELELAVTVDPLSNDEAAFSEACDVAIFSLFIAFRNMQLNVERGVQSDLKV